MDNPKKKEPMPFGPSEELDKSRHHTKLAVSPLVVLCFLALVAFASKNSPNGNVKTIKDEAATKPQAITASATTSNNDASEVATTTEATEATTTTTTVSTTMTQPSVTSTIKAPGIHEPDNITVDSGRKFTSYQVCWGAYHPCTFPMCVFPGSVSSGCILGSGPSIRISCGQGGSLDFIPQSNCRLDEHAVRPTLHCQGTFNVIDTVRVTCHGTRDQALQLDVQLDGQSYRCNKVLNEYNSWNGVVSEKGGTAGQHLSVSILQNSTTSTWTEVLSESRTGYCSTGQECMDPYVSCQSADSCTAVVPYLLTTVSQPDAVAAAVLSTGALDESCLYGYTCQSGDCCDGFCCEN